MNRPTAPLAISLVALFFSLTGASLAADKYLITSTSQIKPSVLQALKGKRGPIGKEGPAGAPGIQGVAGVAGAAGAAGSFNASTIVTAQGPTAVLCPLGDGTCEAGSSAAVCPPGDSVISGGWGDPDAGLPLGDATVAYDAAGQTGTSWIVVAESETTAFSQEYAAFALCAP